MSYDNQLADSTMSLNKITNDGVEVNGTNNGEVKTFHDKEFKALSWGYRHQQSLILFFALTIAYSMRACMGVALVAMTHHEHELRSNFSGAMDLNNNSVVNASVIDVDVEDFKVGGFLNALMLSPPYPTFRWNKKVQDAVIASFFWGYMTLQIPSGQLAHRYGSRRLLCGAMFINCIVSILLPLAAYYGGWICTVIFRIMQGLSQACIFPGMHTFFGKWAPLEERGRLTALTYGGQALGTVLGLPITGFISTTSLGWPGIFRFYGILSGIIGTVLWFYAADTPAKHPRISAAEKKYIEDGLGIKKGDEEKKMKVPWSQILRSKEMYAIIVAHVGQTWGQLTLYSEVPAFMDKIMGLNIKANGLLTALPFMVMWVTNFFFSWFTDMLIVKKVLSVTHTRKLANSIGCVPPALGLIALAFVPKNIYVVEAILIIICGFKISAHTGFQNDEYLWRKVFFVAAGFYFFTNLFYVIFGTAEQAEWNDPDFNKTLDENKADLEANIPMINIEKAKT